MSVDIDQEHRIAILTVEGTLDVERVFGLGDELREHPQFQPGFREPPSVCRCGHR